jgi:ABC-2 type transport system permease protein
MAHLWKIAGFEYRRNVFKKSFVIMLLSVPFFIALMIITGLLIESSRIDSRPVGYVDLAGVITNSALAPEIHTLWSAEYDRPLEFIAYATEEDALAALEARDIQAYFLLPEDYATSRRVEHKYIERPGENAFLQFFDFLQINLVSRQPPQIATRVAAGTRIVVRSLDGSRVNPEGGPTFGLMMPLFITLAFFVLLLMSSNYALAALVDEKENRTMEILVTSTSPFHLIGGKILGIVAISSTLAAVWTVVVVAGILVARRMGVTWFSNLYMDWQTILSTLAIALPAYVMAVALMTALGSVVEAERESQPVGVIFVILHLAPFYVSAALLNQPHSTLMVVLSMLPFTAMMTIGTRNLFTIVPAWQVWVSVAVQVLCAFGAIWLASKAFRWGMQNCGQRLEWRKLFKAKE